MTAHDRMPPDNGAIEGRQAWPDSRTSRSLARARAADRDDQRAGAGTSSFAVA